jgi:hypothetical protein
MKNTERLNFTLFLVFFITISCKSNQETKPIDNLKENGLDTLITKKTKVIFNNGEVFEIHRLDENRNTYEMILFDDNSSAFEVKSIAPEYDKHHVVYDWIDIGSLYKMENNFHVQYLIDSVGVNEQKKKNTYKFSFLSTKEFDAYLLILIFNDKVILSNFFTDIGTCEEVDFPYMGNGRLSVILDKCTIDTSDKNNLTILSPRVIHDFSIVGNKSSRLLPKEYSKELQKEIEKVQALHWKKNFFK